MKTSDKKSPRHTSGLSVEIAGIKFKNPVLTASGTFGYGSEFAPYTDVSRLGGIVVKGLSLKPRAGNPGPRIVETPCGMLNAIGLQNVGVDSFIKEKLPFLKKLRTNVIANIFGETVDDYKEVARRLDGVSGVSAIEINISCPNVKKGGIVQTKEYPFGFKLEFDKGSWHSMIAAFRWGYTKPGKWIATLEQWAKTIPELAAHGGFHRRAAQAG